jgi:hypothetical protein
MAAPAKINFSMYQGSTFNEVLRWESSRKIYKPITNITQAAPCVVTATAHGIPDGWRVKITNVGGMKEINSADVYHVITRLTDDDIELNAINSIAYTPYTSGGIVEYNEPVPLTGYTARMQLRTKIDDVTPIDEYTTVNGKLIISYTPGQVATIQILVPATDTALYTFKTAVYSLELINDTTVVPFATGTITLVKEVTR